MSTEFWHRLVVSCLNSETPKVSIVSIQTKQKSPSQAEQCWAVSARLTDLKPNCTAFLGPRIARRVSRLGRIDPQGPQKAPPRTRRRALHTLHREVLRCRVHQNAAEHDLVLMTWSSITATNACIFPKHFYIQVSMQGWILISRVDVQPFFYVT